MDIVIINDYASIQGGAAQVAVQSAIGLARAGHRVTFIYGAGCADSSLDHPGITSVCLNQFDLLSNPSRLSAAWLGIWNRAVEMQLGEVLDSFGSNNIVVHVHSWVKALSISAIAVVLERRLPLVVTLHDYFSVCPNGGLYNYRSKEVCGLRPMSLNCFRANCDARSYYQKLWRYLRQLVYRKASFPRADINFIAVSDFSLNILRPLLPSEAKYWTIPNPIDVRHSSPAKPHDSDMFTFIGRLSPEKGVSLLSQLKVIPQHQVRVVGAGPLSDSLRLAMPNAKFTGWCSREQIVDYLRDTRALLFTSQLYETQGLVVAEAAALGVPAIVSNATAAQEFIKHGLTGLLFDSGEAGSLECQMVAMKSDDDLVRRMGACAYSEYWSAPTSLDRHVCSLVECYERVRMVAEVSS